MRRKNEYKVYDHCGFFNSKKQADERALELIKSYTHGYVTDGTGYIGKMSHFGVKIFVIEIHV